MARIVVPVTERPSCALCKQLPTSLVFDMVPDGSTTLLRDFEWLDQN